MGRVGRLDPGFNLELHQNGRKAHKRIALAEGGEALLCRVLWKRSLCVSGSLTEGWRPGPAGRL